MTKKGIVVHTHAPRKKNVIDRDSDVFECLRVSISISKIESRWRMVAKQSMKRDSDFSIDLDIYAFKSYSARIQLFSPIISLLLEIYHDNPIIYHTIMQWQLYRSFCPDELYVEWKMEQDTSKERRSRSNKKKRNSKLPSQMYIIYSSFHLSVRNIYAQIRLRSYTEAKRRGQVYRLACENSSSMECERAAFCVLCLVFCIASCPWLCECLYACANKYGIGIHKVSPS